jgi:hypothetical protein
MCKLNARAPTSKETAPNIETKTARNEINIKVLKF